MGRGSTRRAFSNGLRSCRLLAMGRRTVSEGPAGATRPERVREVRASERRSAAEYGGGYAAAMCTLAFAVRPSPYVLLAVTGNRNEFLARPAAPPRVWPELPGVLMPRDEKAGGTWLGLTASGLFVCITNRRGAAPDPSRRSRGPVVLDALRTRAAASVRALCSAFPGNRYNGFHLVFADEREAGVAICDGERLEIRALPPGEP